jgi:uncharacterized small protein (DUF1192 family)
MSDALAKLLASPDATRPERDVEVCLAQGIPSQISALAQELDELKAESFRSSADDSADKLLRKMGQSVVPRIGELKAEIERLNVVMREHTGKLTVAKVLTQGDWRRWADANPAREDGRDGNGRPVLSGYDMSVTGGYCNATALLERLGEFATKWDGEPLSEGQWDALAAKAHPGDLKSAATAIVSIYEGDGAKALPKSSAGWFETPGTDES